jgi:hypothetical protein
MTNLLKWMEVNNKTNDDWVNELKKQQIERLIKELNFYEEKGIKTLIFPWENEIINELKSIEFLNSRLVNLTYDNKNFDSIFDLQNEYKNMKIKYDYESFDGAPPEDHHPSKLCHEVIANSIIKHIENKFL